MLGPSAPVAPPRFSASMLPIDADPAERDFVRLLERALAPSFTLVRRLGAGAMGAVYLARDPVLKRLVAVKVMAPALATDPQARARFEREAQTVASISHPNVVAVYSVGTLENGVPFLVMQYVEGKTMAERIAEGGPLEAPTAKRVLGEVASALAAAHRKGVIHRDIKPSNILWDDETGRALVTDFGIAAVKKHDGSDATKLTQSGVAVGTPAYMSPEQVRGEKVDEKTDVYSLGVLGYELLTGQGPYELANSGEVLAAHLRDTPRKLSSLRADVDPEVERLLEDCLQKEAERRPTAGECEDRITHGASILLEWPPPGLEHLSERFRAALRPTALGGGLIGVPLVLLSVFERGTYVRELLPPIEFVLAVVTLGVFVFIGGCVKLIGFFRAAQKCVDTGYHWGTVFEAVADARGDSGALITGGREYATLTPAKRSTLRRHRVAGAILLLLSALTPVLGFAVGIAVGARLASGPVIVLYSSLVLSLSLAAAWWILDWYERHTLRAARSRRLALSSVQERPAELAAAWTESFNQVRAGQPMGPGPMGKKRRLWRTTLTTLLVAMVVAIVADMLVLLTGVFTTFGMTTAPQFQSVRERVTRAERLRDYRVPADSSISALRAGQALHAVSRSLDSDPPRPWEAAPVISIRKTARVPGASPFGDAPELAGAFFAARRGLSDDQRRYLKALAENPALGEFRLAANAARVDMSAAMWNIPAGSRLTPNDLPTRTAAGLRTAAQANIAAAALDLSSGQPREAERRLREVISVGLLLLRDGRTTIENQWGASVVTQGRTALAAFYDATGRADDARRLVAVGEVPSEDRIEVGGRIRAAQVQQMMRHVALDTTDVRGVRWQMLFNYAIVPCTDLRQLVFGADASFRAVLDSAARTLVRSSSDSVMFAFAELPVDRPRMTSNGVPRVRPPFSVSGWLGSRITGHHTLEACAGMLGMP